MAGGRILVVEDEAISAMDLQIMLEKWGYETTRIATTGEEAVEICRRERPDLVLMDINIHGEMDGIDIARRLDAEFGTTTIFITGYGDEDIITRVKAVSPGKILRKPLNFKTLRSAIESAIGKIV